MTFVPLNHNIIVARVTNDAKGIPCSPPSHPTTLLHECMSPLTSPISSLEASLVPAQFVAVTLTVYMELRAANASELTTEKDTLLAG